MINFSIPDTDKAIDLSALLTIARKAGDAILSVYNSTTDAVDVTYKEDQSPLTQADALSHAVIVQALTLLTPAIPIMSEEGSDIPYETRQHWPTYWCVDPLDGTKEFIKRNGEFTVNIALIHQQQTILGVIYQPVGDLMYLGGKGIGSYRIVSENATWEPIHTHVSEAHIVAVGSRTHSDPEEQKMLDALHVKEFIAAGSSLKFCMIAAGNAQVYYRHGPTMEWDTAAGQAIAEASGASMTTADGAPFSYNKPVLRNGSFLCKATGVEPVKN